MTTTADTNFRGNDSAVRIPIEECNSIQETEYLMSSKEMEKAILKGMDDVKDGYFKEFDDDELRMLFHYSER